MILPHDLSPAISSRDINDIYISVADTVSNIVSRAAEETASSGRSVVTSDNNPARELNLEYYRSTLLRRYSFTLPLGAN